MHDTIGREFGCYYYCYIGMSLYISFQSINIFELELENIFVSFINCVLVIMSLYNDKMIYTYG